jgi:hypothetical protein
LIAGWNWRIWNLFFNSEHQGLVLTTKIPWKILWIFVRFLDG